MARAEVTGPTIEQLDEILDTVSAEQIANEFANTAAKALAIKRGYAELRKAKDDKEMARLRERVPFVDLPNVVHELASGIVGLTRLLFRAVERGDYASDEDLLDEMESDEELLDIKELKVKAESLVSVLDHVIQDEGASAELRDAAATHKRETEETLEEIREHMAEAAEEAAEAAGAAEGAESASEASEAPQAPEVEAEPPEAAGVDSEPAAAGSGGGGGDGGDEPAAAAGVAGAGPAAESPESPAGDAPDEQATK